MSAIPKNPFVLVDGSSYLFRAYHALPPLTNSKGMPTGAVYGVINMLRKLLAQYDPQHVAVVFDCKEKTFRHDMFPEYKANRVAMPDELAVQIKPLHDLIRAMGLPLIAIPGVEADDVIGTLAVEANKKGLFTVISTGDKDMAQLVNGNIICVNTMTERIMDRAGVIEKFEVTPEQIRDYLALVGDSTDNIPGVYKVGPKTAVKWLQEYQNLDTIIANVDKITGKVAENLREAIPRLPLYKELITILTDVKLDVHFDDLVHGQPDNAALKDLFTELEFRTWLKQLDETGVAFRPLSAKAPAAATAAITTAAVPAPAHNYELITTQEQFSTWLTQLKNAPQFAFAAEHGAVAFAVQPGHVAYIADANDYLAALKPLLEDETKVKICHNLKNAIKVLAGYNIKLAGKNFDTMLASYALNSVASRHTIESLALEHLGRQTTNDLAENVDITLQLYPILSQRLAATPALQQVYSNIEIPLVPVLAAMEIHGVLIDVAALNAQSFELGKQIQGFQEQAYTLAGEEFNLGSPKQLQEILFNKLKLPVLEKTPTGQPSTGEAVLQELAADYELPKVILQYRTLSKLKSTYTDKLPQEINANTGRVHTTYQQAVTATGRLSSVDPNLQNIPIRTAEGKKIRAAFIAAPGYKIVSADYSQIELRIMAHLSKDKTLLDTFKNGLDVHQATASEVFGVPLDQVTHAQRRSVKAINFGLIYGMSSFGLAKQLGVSREESQLYIDTYFKRLPGVKQYMDTTRELAAAQGYVETLYGRRLYLPDIKSSKAMLRKAAERAAINAPLQGAQSDIIKIAMIRIHDWIKNFAPDMYMIMQVHDELVFEIPAAKVAEYSKHLVQIMTSAASLDVNLDVGLGVGNNWDEAH